MSYDEAKNCAETEVRPVELIMEEELEYDVLEETAKIEWNNRTNWTKESEMHNFKLSMMWEKLTGRRNVVLKQVYFCTLDIEDDKPMDILAGVNVENRLLLKKQAKKKVKSSAQKIATRWLQIQSSSNISGLLLQVLRSKIFVYFMPGKECQKE
jgi:hypothetical protein